MKKSLIIAAATLTIVTTATAADLYPRYRTPYTPPRQELRQPYNPYQQPQGTYRGRLSNNPYDPDSVANPYGRYGNRYSQDSINNPYGAGSRYDINSPNNPYGRGMRIYGD